MEEILKLEGVCKSYGNKKVVDNASLSLRKGEIYGFVGPNGAGKTTIMKMITNLIKKDSGKIVVFGSELKTGDYEYFKRIGNLIESPSFYKNMTLEENIEIYCDYNGFHDRKEMNKIIKLFGLDEYRKLKASKLSLGNKQRLGIAQALVTMPEILILDEPINGLDPIGIKEIRELLLKLSKEYGITIFISSHILSEVESIADRIGIINRGKIIEEISMDDLRRKCGEYIELTLNDSKKASILLEKTFSISNYKILDNTSMRIYHPNLDGTNVLKELIDNGFKIGSFNRKIESLEEYYIKKIGGDINA
ncbi:MAG: ABC transporter ATP-binding protein [Clostridium sp.]|uniref:ABC transporter ATP-binding protein n=1 Tax=Clostridium sp. TaxID=1506 RepID=UPI003F3582BB